MRCGFSKRAEGPGGAGSRRAGSADIGRGDGGGEDVQMLARKKSRRRWKRITTSGYGGDEALAGGAVGAGGGCMRRGQVRRTPGALDVTVNENLTAGQAIMRAGGFADFANLRKVKVIRSGGGMEPAATGGISAPASQAKPEQPITLDMEQILNEGKTDKDIVLQPGDLIIVPSRLINF